MQICSKLNASTLGKYELGQFSYIFVSRQKPFFFITSSTQAWIQNKTK